MKLRFLFSLAALAFATLLSAQGGMEQMMQPLPLEPNTRYGKLDNGLTYYIRHNEYPKGQANFYIAQKVGSVLEEEDQRGLAHFLEHMCFNGTENFPENSLIRYLETLGVKFGAQLNAYTSVDETVYNINNVPTGREATIDSVLLILHDWSHNLTLDPKEIDKERGVIHEECDCAPRP
jgi:zinc protease